MITRKEYREQVENLEGKKILTHDEFYQLPPSKRLRYANMQKDLNLPVTVEQDTYYDTSVVAKYEPKKIISDSKVAKGFGSVFLAISTLVSFVLSFCGIG